MSQVVAWEGKREDEENKKDMPRSGGSMSYGLSEPEPSMQDAILVDDDLYNQADAETRETKSQLGRIEQQLFGLDKRWQSVEKEREDWELLRYDLLEKLRASETKHHKLHTMHNELTTKHSNQCDTESKLREVLQQSEDTSEKLRQDLGVSEEQANARQSEVLKYQSRETVLNTQASNLHARLYHHENESATLRASLESSEHAKDDHAHRLNTLHEAHSALTAAESKLREEHAQHVKESTALVAKKDSELQQHVESLEAVHAEKERNHLHHSKTIDALTSEKEAQKREHEEQLNLTLQEKDHEIRRQTDKLDMIMVEKDLEIQQQIQRTNTLAFDLEAKENQVKGSEEIAKSLDSWKKIAEERAEELEKAMQRIHELEKSVQILEADNEKLSVENKELSTRPAKGGPHVELAHDSILSKAKSGEAVDVELPPQPVDHELPPRPGASDIATVFAPKCDMLLRVTSEMRSGWRPTQCQVDSSLKEIRLLPLGPVGPARIIPFDHISTFEQLGETEIQLHWMPIDSGVDGSQMKLNLQASDESATSMLVACLTVFDRARPGSSVGTPDTPRTPTSEHG
jgi:hypothetical protein